MGLCRVFCAEVFQLMAKDSFVRWKGKVQDKITEKSNDQGSSSLIARNRNSNSEPNVEEHTDIPSDNGAEDMVSEV